VHAQVVRCKHAGCTRCRSFRHRRPSLLKGHTGVAFLVSSMTDCLVESQPAHDPLPDRPAPGRKWPCIAFLLPGRVTAPNSPVRLYVTESVISRVTEGLTSDIAISFSCELFFPR
jgi:hypothetical protein